LIIALLPFVNMSSDPEQEYFSDGITEEVLNLLVKIPELKVTSRTSVFSFKGQKVVKALQIQLLGEAPLATSTNTEAYNLYLRGKHFATWVALTLGETERALEFAQLAVDLDPLDYSGLRNLGTTYWALGQLEEEERIYRRILELYPDSSSTRLSGGWISPLSRKIPI
jgi:tetratricopeptide (TPR) repeat protein